MADLIKIHESSSAVPPSPLWRSCSEVRSPKAQISYSDRFIPTRSATARLNFSVLDRDAAAEEAAAQPRERQEEASAAYGQLLRTELLGLPSAPNSPMTSPMDRPPNNGTGAIDLLKSPGSPCTKKMFRFTTGDEESPRAGPRTDSPYRLSPVGRDSALTGALSSPKRAPMRIARSPFKVLDAPALQDDFYLNLVDWSSQNMLAVGLGPCVYLWSACTSKVTKLCDLSSTDPADTVCSVSWSQRGTYLSVGTNKGDTQLWDAHKVKMIRNLGGHRARVGTMSWSSHILSSGSRDRSILQRDVRAREDYVHKFTGHRSEVCGLKWSPDDRELASGGNDNQLYIWNLNSQAPLLKFSDHSAAVKAIAWSPHQHGLLASGGGTADRCIRFWNTATNTALSCIDTGSQVCNLSWSKNVNEIVSTHGYSQNQIIVWKHPTMTKLATLTGHTFRVLYLAVSPDGQTIVTGAGDETLRFWNVFPGPKSQSSVNDSAVGSMMRCLIR
eukprot:jgi/Astpho2/8369/fgenesh1_pm.00122_%23_25_t